MRTAIKIIAIYIGLSLVIGLTWVVFSYPNTPSTAAQWCWVFALSLPIQLACELVGHIFWNNKATRFLEQKTAAKAFSVLRICYGVVLVVVFAGLLLGAGYGWQVLRPVPVIQ